MRLQYDSDSSVPRIVMQTWKDTNIPEAWKPSIQSIQRHMKGWNHVLMTDKDNRHFVEAYFPEFLPVYDGFKHGIQRADAIRYMWLYVNGGVYMDLDFELTATIDHLFSGGGDLYLMRSSNFPSSYTNSFMASSPRHPFWLEVLSRMRETVESPPLWAIGKHLEVMMSTGPGMLSSVLGETVHEYVTLPYKVLSPENICCIGDDEYGLLRKLPGSSWAGWDTIIGNWIHCNTRTVIALVIIIVLVVVIVWMVLSSSRRCR